MDTELCNAALRKPWYGGEWIIERRLTRWFYRFKAAVCVLLNREYAPQNVQGITWGWMFYYDAFIPIVVLNAGASPGYDHHPTVYWHETLAVGRGVFRNWLYVVNSDSSD